MIRTSLGEPDGNINGESLRAVLGELDASGVDPIGEGVGPVVGGGVGPGVGGGVDPVVGGGVDRVVGGGVDPVVGGGVDPIVGGGMDPIGGGRASREFFWVQDAGRREEHRVKC